MQNKSKNKKSARRVTRARKSLFRQGAFALLVGCIVAGLIGVAAAAPPLPPSHPGTGAEAGRSPNKLSSGQAIALLNAEQDPYWINAKKIIRKDVLELAAQDQAEIARGIHHHKFMRGDESKKQIALTFDDGPHPTFTPRILAILKQYHVPATFFVVGEMAERFPQLIRDEVAAGHLVGNHTYHHVSLVKIPEDDAAAEIKSCGEVLSAILGHPPHLFRPPGGVYDRAVARISDELGYEMILWTDDPGDYASPGESLIVSRTLSRVEPGGIILVHDGIEQTIKVLPQIISTLQKRGYTFVTIDQMMRSTPPARPLAGIPAPNSESSLLQMWE